MENVELTCDKRETVTKGQVRSLRSSGRIPAILYGPATKPTPLVLPGAELKARVSGHARAPVIRLKSAVPEIDGKYVVLKDIQRAPVSGEILHADLYEVDLKRTLRVEVPIRFTGRAVGVTDGGILQPLARYVTVECLPLEIPEFVEVDVSALGIHDVIHVSVLRFAGNVRPIYDHDFPVVSVLPPTVAEVAAPAAAAAVEGAPAEAAPAEGAAPAAPAAGAAPAEAAKEAAPAAAGGGKKAAEPAAKK